MQQITLRPLVITLALSALGLSLVVGDRQRAEANVRMFYTQITAAEFQRAHASMDEAIRLWPTNARYYGWRGYVTSQGFTKPVSGVRCSSEQCNGG